MSRLPLIDAKKMEKLLQSIGFTKTRQKGSHIFYRHPDGRTTTLPHHPGRVLARPLLRKILNDVKLSVDEYAGLIEKL